jgi:hypothetical protein
VTERRLGLLARPGEGEALRPLVRALAREVPVHAERAGRTSTALLATSPAALARADHDTLPAAVWVAHGQWSDDEPGDAVVISRPGPTLVVTPSPDAADAARRAGRHVLVVVAPLVDDPSLDPRWPLVRARWRERESLPEHLVVVVRPGDAAADEAATGDAATAGSDDDVRRVAADDPTLDDLLAVAAAVVTIDAADVATRARACGAPTVEAAGGDEETALTSARALAADPLAASRCAADGVARARRSGVTRAARTVIDLLGLTDDDAGLEARVTSRLTELGLPVAGPFRARLHDAFAPFPAPPSVATTSGEPR